MLYSLALRSSNRYAYAFSNRACPDWESTICTHCGRTVSTPRPQTVPDEYEVEGGSRYPDFLEFTGAWVGEHPFLLSAQAYDLLREAGISGLDNVEPVSVVRKMGGQWAPVAEPCYHQASVIGTVTLDLPAMQLKRKNLCPDCGQFSWSRQRIYTIPAALDMDTWSGHDLCRVGDFPAVTVCSERVAEIIRKHRLTGAEMGPIADMFRAL